MLPKHAYPAEIAGIADVSRRDNASEGDGTCFMKSKPPVPMIEFRDRCRLEECQPMKFTECIHSVVVFPVNPANPVHRSH